MSQSRIGAFLSKRRLAWAGLAGVCGCAVACSLPPLLIALGGGAAATYVAGLMTDGAELAVGLGVFLTALGVFAWRGRTKTTPAAAHEHVPVVCDPFVFSQEQRAAHVELTKDVIARWPKRVEELETGYAFHYEGNHARFLELARWAAEEHQCCSWATFRLELDPAPAGAPAPMRLRMMGGIDGRALLAEGMRMLAEEPELFLNPRGKIALDPVTGRSKAASGCGC